MIFESTECRDAEVEVLVLEVSRETKVNLWESASKHLAVACGDDTVAIEILIEAVTHISTWLQRFAIGIDMSIKILLSAGNAFIFIAVELTDLLSHVSHVGTSEILLCTETERSNLVLEGTEVSTHVIVETIRSLVAISERELKTAVLHRCRIHCHRSVGNTGICRNRHAIEKVFRNVLVPLGCELDAVVEHCEVDTDVGSLLLLPSDVLVYEGRNGRTSDRVIAEAICHVVTVHCSLELVFTDVLVTELTVATTHLEHVDDIVAEWEPLFLVEAPAERC